VPTRDLQTEGAAWPLNWHIGRKSPSDGQALCLVGGRAPQLLVQGDLQPCSQNLAAQHICT
jgi:hypothetical protein